MSGYRPHMATKVRSEVLMQAIGGKLANGMRVDPMPCTLRIAGLAPGQRCMDAATCVGCHTGDLGKGVSTKVTDLSCVAGCMACHGILDMTWQGWQYVHEHRQVEMLKRVIAAIHETQAMLVDLGVIQVAGAELI